MSFSQTRFMGASVMGLNTNLGFGAQPSSMTITLVEDTRYNDSFSPVPIGSPAYFSIGSLEFGGILQKWEKRISTAGITFDVLLTDPRDILSGVQLLTSSYSGATSSVPNLINIFGFWENLLGFGGALVNESGIPWSKIYDALGTIVNDPDGNSFGGPINFRGYQYFLDLGVFAGAVPADYKVPIPAVDILTMLVTIASDIGCDIYFTLHAGPILPIIRANLISRLNAPPLGTITGLVSAGGLISSSAGLELRNEESSAFLIGGNQTALYTTATMEPFWGFRSQQYLSLYDIQEQTPITGYSNTRLFVQPLYVAPLRAFSSSCKYAAGARVWLRNTLDPTVYDEVGILRPADGVVSPSPTNPNHWVIEGFFGGELVEDNILVMKAPMVAAAGHVANMGPVITVKRDNSLPKQDGHFVQQFIDTQSFVLDAAPIADIIGNAFFYPTSTMELRLALSGFNDWQDYITAFNPSLALYLDIQSPSGMNLAFIPDPKEFTLTPELFDKLKRPNTAALLSGEKEILADRLYKFVLNAAQEFYGAKVFVRIPFTLSKIEPDSINVQYSHEFSSDGGYMEDGSVPLGLVPLNQETFKSEDGRFLAFAKYPASTLTLADLSNFANDEFILQNDGMYVAVQVDPKIVFNPYPGFVVTLPRAVYEISQDLFGGDIDEISRILGFHKDEIGAALESRQQLDVIGADIHPQAIYPSQIAIPLKSNVLTYGPWTVNGAIGRTRFEQDDTLVPWNYGGISNMNSAALSKISQMVTNTQISEAGYVEYQGLPSASLGAVLVTNGPQIAGMDVNFGTAGVTTSYRFNTFSPKLFGNQSKVQQQRLDKFGKDIVELRRRAKYIATTAIRNKQTRAGSLKRGFETKLANELIKGKTPHEMITATVMPLTTGLSVIDTYTDSLGEFTRNIAGPSYYKKAGMSLEGLVRPFKTAVLPTYSSGDALFSTYLEPILNSDGLITSKTYNPFQSGNDIGLMVNGPVLHGLKQRSEIFDYENARPLSLRGPMVMTGWGYDIRGNCVPSGSNNEYENLHLYKTDKWKTGPLDPIWDDLRGVWTSHDLMLGVLNNNLGAGSSTLMSIYSRYGDTNEDITVWNFFNTNIPAGSRVFAGYVATDNRWYTLGHEYGFASSGTPGGPPLGGGAASGNIIYTLTGTLDWTQNPTLPQADLDLYIRNETSGVTCYYNNRNAGGLILNKDANVSQAATPLPPEVTQGTFFVPNHFKCYYNQYSINTTYGEKTPTIKTVSIKNDGFNIFYINGSSLSPGATNTYNLAYGGYGTGDIHNFPGGLGLNITL